MEANRPTSVTVFGVLNIVFGALGIICTPLVLLMPYAARSGRIPNPVLEVMMAGSLLRVWYIGSQALGIIAAIVLLAAGIGLLGLRPWARTASIVYAVYALLIGAVGTIITLTVVMPRVMEMAQQTQGPQAAGMMGGMVGGSCGGIIAMIYPVLLLIFMTRPKVVAAFRK